MARGANPDLKNLSLKAVCHTAWPPVADFDEQIDLIVSQGVREGQVHCDQSVGQKKTGRTSEDRQGGRVTRC